MSEGVEQAADGSPPGGAIEGPRIFAAGILPIVFAIFAFWASARSVGLPGSGSATFLIFGLIPFPTTVGELTSAGTFLTISGCVLAAFGAVVIVGRHKIENPQDYYGGLALVGLALVALWASSELPGMRGFAFGPGTAPRLFAMVLGALGAGITFFGLVTEGPPVGRYDILAPILIAMSYTFFLFAQGTAMQVAGWIMGAAGVVIAVIGLLGSRRAYVRGPLFITISVLFFAATVRPLGLVICSFATIMICAAASEEVRWRESFIVAVALTLFCSLLFPYGLNLPMPLWPQFWR
jgi:putative tricarboxylic transport membrane protein